MFFFNKRRLFLGKFLERLRRDRVAFQTLVHEGDVVLQNAAVVRPPVVLHRCRVKAVERGLHSVAVRRQRRTPSQVVWAVQIGNDHFAQRHGAVSDGLEQLINDRHRRRVNRLHPGSIEYKPSSRAREQSEDKRVLGKNVLLEDLPGIAVELEHRRVELQDVFGPDFGRACRFSSDDLLEVGRQLRSVGRRA